MKIKDEDERYSDWNGGWRRPERFPTSEAEDIYAVMKDITHEMA
jgi:hypothetical protein